mgnify:CR=1 FL=1
MTERIKTLEEAKALLAEYDTLRGLDAIINWTGYARLPYVTYACICGKNKISSLMDIDEMRRIITKGWEWRLEHIKSPCYGHDDLPDSEDEEDNETEDA